MGLPNIFPQKKKKGEKKSFIYLFFLLWVDERKIKMTHREIDRSREKVR
jgi:hypothetical protein